LEDFLIYILKNILSKKSLKQACVAHVIMFAPKDNAMGKTP
jgi:hypothetical protein